MKKINIIFIFLLVFTFESLGQANRISIDSLYKIRNNENFIREIASCDTCLIDIVEQINNCNEKELVLYLNVLNNLGAFSDGINSEIISSCLFNLFNKFPEIIIREIYSTNLNNLNSFLLNELCSAIENKTNKQKAKVDIIKCMKHKIAKNKNKKAFRLFINQLKKFNCNS
jgi:transposase-like protein